MWWYRARSRFIERLLRRENRSYARALDFGAGFGACVSLLKNVSDSVDAYEIDPEALDGCKSRGYRVATADWHELEDMSYDLVGAFDVIEHLQDDIGWLQKIRARMMDGGTLVISVPAYQWMWSEHDVLHRHFRRYTRASISSVLRAAGFEVVRATYWNFFLLPAAYLLRLLGGGGGGDLTPSAPVNACLDALLWLESRPVPYVSLPWGIGIIVVAKKK